MAVIETTIEAVRIAGEDGDLVVYPWTPSAWYEIRDDNPWIDILVKGRVAQPAKGSESTYVSENGESKRKAATLRVIEELEREQKQWQRWDLEEEVARERRFGEVSLPLKVPKDVILQCYIIPTRILTLSHVLAILDDIRKEIGVNAAWDHKSNRTVRSWAQTAMSTSAVVARSLISEINSELSSAILIRREPFVELGPATRSDVPLPENAIVSHWSLARQRMLRNAEIKLRAEISLIEDRKRRKNPAGREAGIDSEIEILNGYLDYIYRLKVKLARIVDEVELRTLIHMSPVFQRDHRIRNLLRAFAPPQSETLSSTKSERSHYPPLLLNDLWEIWGVVWIIKHLRSLGFIGGCTRISENLNAASWTMRKNEITIDVDYEAHPTLIDYDNAPPVHERREPIFEWAARYQSIDENLPYIGSELRCSPDYLMRITGPLGLRLIVGDASLADPRHHGQKDGFSGAKPVTVERYSHTIAWVSPEAIVRCHPMGQFVIFPPPSEAWERLQQIPNARDCTLFSPNPSCIGEAEVRLNALLCAVYDDSILIA